MMGVHGNGLTALLWMRPTPRSTVMEFFFPEGFAQDYEYTTRALGMVHYGFWNDQWVLFPSLCAAVADTSVARSRALTFRLSTTLKASRATRFLSTALQSHGCVTND